MRAPFSIAAAAGFAALSSLSGAAEAQANRTFVSGFGSDANPCSLSAPCRSFAGALSQTNAGGEITILDPAGYGSVTINKSVSIVNDGVGEAGVTASSGSNGITVSTGGNDVVNLRGLTLVGASGSGVGVLFTATGALNIQNCVIRGFGDKGMDLEPSGSATFNITDTIVSNVVNFAVKIVSSGTGSVAAMVNRVEVTGAGVDGFLIDGANSTGTVDVTIANSAASNNGTGIVTVSAPANANTQVMVVNSVVANNGTGILETGQNSTTYLAKNTISGNGLAFSVSAGALFSFGDNDVKGNFNDGGAISLVATK